MLGWRMECGRPCLAHIKIRPPQASLHRESAACKGRRREGGRREEGGERGKKSQGRGDVTIVGHGKREKTKTFEDQEGGQRRLSA